ncbi:hypothetical protein MKX07_003242, partial [Trichoderma sp. CBMAI-0711]
VGAMRLLELGHDDISRFTRDLAEGSIPPYAILSHRWGAENEEVVLKDIIDGAWRTKAGYDKIKFCADRAKCDNLQHIWVDSCCIDKTNNVELSEAINSMFRWYKNAARCYVYLSDVSFTGHEQDNHQSRALWEKDFRNSEWFTRGWTLQELLAPASVEFFTREGWRLGDKESLAPLVHEITGIAIPALLGHPLSEFSIDERFEWAKKRTTTRQEDWAYSLLGVFGVFMPLIYGEGRTNATRRLKAEIKDALAREEASNRLRVASQRAGTSFSSGPKAKVAGDASAVSSRLGKGQCNRHSFALDSNSDDELGRGSYGVVYKAIREKQMRNTDLELKCYMTLDHPHIIRHIQHEVDESKMHIYTEYCHYRDLEYMYFQAHHPSRRVHTDEFAWALLEALASALSRCHHGLAACQVNGVLSQYSEFEREWETILHRDIKPGNVLVAERNDPRELVPKLGDFGTSFKLEDDGKLPSTQQAGTKIYWAPEIAENARLSNGRVTEWSTKSDIWGVGAVLYRIMTEEIPSQDRAKRPLNLRPRRRADLTSDPKSALLVHLVKECLETSPAGRPSALQLLAVAIKADTSERGFRKSASFWRAVSRHSNSDIASSVTKHFVHVHLPMLAESKAVFDPIEIAIIMSLVKMHCPEYLFRCANQLCAGFTDEMAGSTAFHALTHIRTEDEETMSLAMDVSKWPESIELMNLALRKNKAGMLPSATAAAKQNISLCVKLTQIEDQFRSKVAEEALNSQSNALQGQHETACREEFNFMCDMLTSATGGQISIPASHAAMIMIETAERGYSNVPGKENMKLCKSS